MADTVKFPANLPVELALRFDTGLECQSQFNNQDQVCYTLTDDRRMYVSPAVARKIKDLEIVRNVPFTICKKEKQVGQRKAIDWEVARLDQVREHIASTAPEAAHPSKLTAPEIVAVPPNGSCNGNGSANGRGNGNGSHGAPVPPIHPALLSSTGKAAIDIVLEVEAYAREKGMTDFAFGAENIQKIWLSLFIGAQGRR